MPKLHTHTGPSASEGYRCVNFRLKYKKGMMQTMSRANVRRSTRAICEAAIFIALALALGLVEFKIWAQGGSVDFVMIPLIIFALRWGAGWGIGAGFVYGILKCMLLEGMVYGWQALFLDYAVAYACCGLAGFFREKRWGAEVGTVLSCVARFLCHLFSGVILWGMPDEYFGMQMNNVWIYSSIYNGSYMLPNMIIALAVMFVLKMSLGKYLRAEDLRG